MNPDKVREELWRRGHLRWKLRAPQIPVYDFVASKGNRHIVVAMHRGAGKSYVAGVIATEKVIVSKGVHVKYIGPTGKLARAVSTPNFKKIWEDCPPDLYPKWRHLDGCWEFPQGGYIWIMGSDLGNADNARGTDNHFTIFDEEAFADDPDYVIKDIILPRAIPVGGQILHISTPPKSPSHPFGRRMKEARESGIIFELTVKNNPAITPELLAEYVKESGGEHTTTFRREMLCELVTEERDAAIPELIDRDWSRIHGTDQGELRQLTPKYVGVHFDFSRLSSAAFGYWDYDRKTLVIEDELVLKQANTGSITEAIKQKQEELWPGAPRISRFTKAKEQLLIDLAREHRLPFIESRDDDIHTGLNVLRTMFSQGQVQIHPRCVELTRHLGDAVWNDSRAGFGDSGDGGRFEGIHAVVHLVRNVQQSYDPRAHLDPRTNPHVFVPATVNKGWQRVVGKR